MSYLIRFLTLSLLLSCTSAMAHPGHDHAGIMAGLIHAAWLLPVAVAGWLMFKKRYLFTSILRKKQ